MIYICRINTDNNEPDIFIVMLVYPASDTIQFILDRRLIDQKRLSKESALSFISSVLEKRSTPVE